MPNGNNSLVQGLDVFAIRLGLRVDSFAHRRVADDVQGRHGDHVVQVEVVPLLKLGGDDVDELVAVEVHREEKVLEDGEMEGWS